MPTSISGNRNASQIDIGNVNFGNAQLGSISGLKFNDLNANGLIEANEPPLGNWQIYLDLNNNGRLDPGEPFTFTNASGNYSFLNLPPATYTVREVQQQGWRQTTPNPNAITITSGANLSNINFGNNFFVGSISGVKFNDLNRNARQDAGEPPIPNWQIYLDLNGNGNPDPNEPSTLTDASGNYSFRNLPTGNYLVREVQKPGFIQTTPNPSPIAVNPGANISGINFGNNFFVGSISGLKFNDLNANGQRDANEPPLSNWQIYLDLNNNNSLDPGEPFTFTTAQGTFTFANLPANNYLVREVQQPGWKQTTPNPGPVNINGTNASGITFGNNFPIGTISGYKFNDLNGNGVNEPAEPRLANWQIYLDLNNNNQLDRGEPSTLTNAQGNYSFVNLPEGTYLVREVQQQGWRQTTPNPTPITITNGTNATNIAFGNTVVVGSISGVKFNDLNANGILDPGEPPLANTQIYIDVNNNSRLDPGEPATATDAQGAYSFRNVPPGTYVLRELPPPGFIPTTPPVIVTVNAGNPSISANSIDSLTGNSENESSRNSLSSSQEESPLSGSKSLSDDPLTSSISSDRLATEFLAEPVSLTGLGPTGQIPDGVHRQDELVTGALNSLGLNPDYELTAYRLGEQLSTPLPLSYAG